MAKKKFQILLTSTVLAFILSGCGNRGFNPPSDEEMLRNFLAYEDEFNEKSRFCRIVRTATYILHFTLLREQRILCVWQVLAQRNAPALTPCSMLSDARESFSQAAIAGGRLIIAISTPFLLSRLCATLLHQVSHSCIIVTGGLIGPSVDKTYEYKPDNQPADTCDGDLNKLIEIAAANSEILGITADKHIKGNWYIELFYDK